MSRVLEVPIAFILLVITILYSDFVKSEKVYIDAQSARNACSKLRNKVHSAHSLSGLSAGCSGIGSEGRFYSFCSFDSRTESADGEYNFVPDTNKYCYSLPYFSGGKRVPYILNIKEYRFFYTSGTCPSNFTLKENGECKENISSINEGVSDYNTCHPINISSGNKFFEHVEYVGIDNVVISMTFNSFMYKQFWGMSYRQRLDVSRDDIVENYRSDGRVITFSHQENSYIVPSQRSETLIKANDQYELTLADNTREIYDLSGNLLRVVYSNAVTHIVEYIDDTIIVSSPSDRIVMVLKEPYLTSVVSHVDLSDGNQISYTYDEVNAVERLLSAQHSDGATRTYLYENTQFPHYVTGIIDENGNRISSVEYDAQGRAISSEVGEPNSGIERTEIDYHDDGSRTLTNALGKQTTYHFTEFNGEYKMTRVEGHPSANCASANQAYTYDANGFMASKTDWKGNVTTYINNDRGLEVSRTEASGTSEARTTLTEWHPNFNLRTKITEPERETVFTYDIKGRLTSQEVSPR